MSLLSSLFRLLDDRWSSFSLFHRLSPREKSCTVYLPPFPDNFYFPASGVLKITLRPYLHIPLLQSFVHRDGGGTLVVGVRRYKQRVDFPY